MVARAARHLAPLAHALLPVSYDPEDGNDSINELWTTYKQPATLDRLQALAKTCCDEAELLLQADRDQYLSQETFTEIQALAQTLRVVEQDFDRWIGLVQTVFRAISCLCPGAVPNTYCKPVDYLSRVKTNHQGAKFDMQVLPVFVWLESAGQMRCRTCNFDPNVECGKVLVPIWYAGRWQCVVVDRKGETLVLIDPLADKDCEVVEV